MLESERRPPRQPHEFFENIKNEAIEAGMKRLERQVHNAAASIIDPETGKHAEVFVRRRRSTELTLVVRRARKSFDKIDLATRCPLA